MLTALFSVFSHSAKDISGSPYIKSIEMLSNPCSCKRSTVFGALKTVDRLQEQGFDNISIDLIYGLPEMSLAEWEKTLNKAVSMNIQHISAYHLTYEKNTVFDKLKKSGMLKPPSDEFSKAQFETMIDFFEKNGFIHYEISNFGRMGRFS